MKKKMYFEDFLGVFVMKETKPDILEPISLEEMDPFAKGQSIKETARIWIQYYNDGTAVFKIKLYGSKTMYADLKRVDDEEAYIIDPDDFRPQPVKPKLWKSLF